jgi:hypothetical protein
MREVLTDCEPAERCKLPLRLPNLPSTQDAIFCPICECADEHDLPLLTESRSVLNDIIGRGIDDWTNPLWRSALMAGDFLFFGSECNIFAPGIGFDENRKIFENMWQGVGTMGNPLSFPWVGGAASDAGVSYAAVTANPHRRDGARWSECPEHRYALVWADPAEETELLGLIRDLYPERGTGEVRSALRGLMLDRTALVLEPFATATPVPAPTPRPSAPPRWICRAPASWRHTWATAPSSTSSRPPTACRRGCWYRSSRPPPPWS